MSGDAKEPLGSEDLSAVLISDLRRPGSTDLLAELSRHFFTEVQPAIWVTEEELRASNEVDKAAFNAKHLRDPLRGEVGCALAHRAAYHRMLRKTSKWFLVLEDDAQILNGLGLKETVVSLTRALPHDVPCIVNLNHCAASRPKFWNRVNSLGVWRPLAPTFTTTAYLINSQAAQKLVENQTPVRSQADWPVSRSDSLLFLQQERALVQPRASSISLVDPGATRSKFSLKLRLEMWTGVWYWRHRRFFRGSRDYWALVLLPRLLRHLYRAS